MTYECACDSPFHFCDKATMPRALRFLERSSYFCNTNMTPVGFCLESVHHHAEF